MIYESTHELAVSKEIIESLYLKFMEKLGKMDEIQEVVSNNFFKNIFVSNLPTFFTIAQVEAIKNQFMKLIMLKVDDEQGIGSLQKGFTDMSVKVYFIAF